MYLKDPFNHPQITFEDLDCKNFKNKSELRKIVFLKGSLKTVPFRTVTPYFKSRCDF
jgi:hypothetical protein